MMENSVKMTLTSALTTHALTMEFVLMKLENIPVIVPELAMR